MTSALTRPVNIQIGKRHVVVKQEAGGRDDLVVRLEHEVADRLDGMFEDPIAFASRSNHRASWLVSGHHVIFEQHHVGVEVPRKFSEQRRQQRIVAVTLDVSARDSLINSGHNRLDHFLNAGTT
jgi:hypothetical protein